MQYFIKLAYRQLLSTKIYTSLNLLGLIIGIYGFTVIFLHVKSERSFDKFNHEHELIYRINAFRWAGDTANITHKHAAAVAPLINAIQDEYPYLNASTKIYNDGAMVFNSMDDTFEPIEDEKIYFVTKDFFKVFSIDILSGSDFTLDDPLKVFLSEDLALRTFGTIDIVGKSIKATGQTENEYEVIGVFQNFPQNSHFTPEALFSYKSYTQYIRPEFNADSNWFWSNFYTYIKLSSNRPQKDIERDINKIVKLKSGDRYGSRDSGLIFKVQPLNDIHLHSQLLDEFELNGDSESVNWLELISYLILIIAWVNYINLTTATSIERAKEIGIKKVLGSSKRAVFIQFLTETTLVNALAILVSMLMVFISIPQINNYFNTSIQILDIEDLLMLSAGFLLLGIVGSFYPALVLNNINLSSMTKGYKKSKTGVWTRYGLVLFQFITAIGLLFCTLIVFEQVNKLRSTDYGINVSQVITIPAPLNSSNGNQKYEIFKNQSEKISNIESVSNSSLLPGNIPIWYSTFYFNDLPDNTDQWKYLYVNLVEHGFEDAFNLEFLAGESFSENRKDSSVLVLNETAVKELGETNQTILGRTLKWRYSPQIPLFERRVIGVVKDYSQQSHTLEAIPMIFTLRRYTPADFSRGNFIVKIQTNENLEQTVNELEKKFASIYPSDPFQYSFLDQEFDRQFQNDIVFGKLFNAFTILLMVVANIGLFGLSSYTLLQRAKEISIRKTLGASNLILIKLTSKNYLILMFLACLIISPIGYVLMSNWLDNFEIKIQLQIWHFGLPIILVSLISLVTIISLTIKAGNKNVLENLRSE